VRSALNRIEEVQAIRLSPYADVYTLTFRPGVMPNEEMVFCDKANCITCHAGPDFTDEEFRTIGIGWNGEAYTDLGRGDVTGKAEWAGRFRVPILRELRWTAPYMHDGSLKTLEEVVDYYDRGGIEGAPTDLKGPIGLSAAEKADLVAFLESLSSPGLPSEMAEVGVDVAPSMETARRPAAADLSATSVSSDSTSTTSASMEADEKVFDPRGQFLPAGKR
jgi:hypothetical protein